MTVGSDNEFRILAMVINRDVNVVVRKVVLKIHYKYNVPYDEWIFADSKCIARIYPSPDHHDFQLDGVLMNYVSLAKDREFITTCMIKRRETVYNLEKLLLSVVPQVLCSVILQYCLC